VNGALDLMNGLNFDWNYMIDDEAIQINLKRYLDMASVKEKVDFSVSGAIFK